MGDAITRASALATAETQGTLSDATPATKDALPTPPSPEDLLGDLPLDVDPELLLRQKEAEALELQAKLQEKILVDKEEIIENTKEKITGLGKGILFSLLPKLPLIDPKILQAVALAKQIKSLYEQRKKISKENLSKGKELYSYPMTPITPEIPDIPTELPQISRPTIPNLPLR
jgi:hypothetical protein